MIAGLREYLPASAPEGDTHTLELETDARVRNVLQELGIPDDIPITVLVNRIHAGPDTPLHDGDAVSVLRMISGG